MCGLIGIFKEKAAQELLDCLKLLQYRGYDSYGVSTIANGEFEVFKKLGPIDKKSLNMMGKIGIAHTRWATHGEVALKNTHPIYKDHLAVAQNGIITNFEEIKATFPKYIFDGETDTEVILPLFLGHHKIDMNYISKTLSKLEGSFAILVLNSKENKIYFMVRGVNPLLIGIKDEVRLIGSDVKLFAGFDEVIDVQDGQFGIISEDEFVIYPEEKRFIKIDLPEVHTKKPRGTWFESEFSHQPAILREAFATPISYPEFKPASIALTGCGSAYLAGCVAQYWFRDFANLPAHAYIAPDLPSKNSLVIGISQSGETADLLKALKNTSAEYKLAFLNNTISSATKYVDSVIPVLAKEEISVASTKATTCQMLALLRYACHLAKINMDEDIENMFKLMDQVVAKRLYEVEQVAARILKAQNLLIIARGNLYPIACECALKLKELAYLHAEAIPSSELKHGPLALIDSETVVVCFAPEKDMVVAEITARGGQVFVLTEHPEYYPQVPTIKMPHIRKELLPFLYILPSQWLAYSLAKLRGNEIDMPRNLAKSVTVE